MARKSPIPKGTAEGGTNKTPKFQTGVAKQSDSAGSAKKQPLHARAPMQKGTTGSQMNGMSGGSKFGKARVSPKGSKQGK